MRATYLSRNKGTEAPSSLFFVHTEHFRTPNSDDVNKSDLSFLCFSASRVRLEKSKIRTRESIGGNHTGIFWDFLFTNSSKERCSWVFATQLVHQLTKLDFWKLLEAGTLTLEPLPSKRPSTNGKPSVSWAGKMCLEDRPAFVVCRQGLSTYKMVDTVNYWPSGIENIAEDNGIAVTPRPKDGSSVKDFQEHANNSVQIIETAVIDLIRKWRGEQCGTFQMTAAMLSMTNFRHTCGIRTGEQDKVDIVCMPNHKSHVLEREAAFGDSPQCMYIGERRQKIFHIDCNSLYPYVMRENCFPRRFVRYQDGGTLNELASSANCYGIVARVFLNSTKEDFPCRVDGKPYYLTGDFWASLCGPELRRAIDTKSIHRVGTFQVYSIAPLFRRWVDSWHDRKIASSPGLGGRKGDYEFCKLILNSLSGKWIQRGRQWREQPGRHPLVNWDAWPEYNADTKKWQKCRGVAGNTQVLTDDEEPRHSFPLIYAYITACAREYMRKVIAVAGRDNCYYMATDSLILNEEGYDRLNENGYHHETKLGKFKLKGEYASCMIHGSNWYELDGVQTASGLLGASLASGGDGSFVELVERVGSLIRKTATSEIGTTIVKVPLTIPERRGTIDSEHRWHPYHVKDWTNPAQLSVDQSFHREYSLDTMAVRRLLICDV